MHRIFEWILIAAVVSFLVSTAFAHGSDASSRAGSSGLLSCAPAPCVLPPVWPENSGFFADAPIAANPNNPQQTLLGSSDSENCPRPSGLGFYLSSDGGSVWNLTCMLPLLNGGAEYIPDFGPILTYA